MVPSLFSIATSACLVLAPALQAPPAKPATPAPDATVERQVDAIAAEYLAQPGGVGLTIGVAQKGRLLLAKGYGLADAEHQVPANGETLFRIASVTKQFTAAAILQLVEQGQLALDDTLAELLPEFPTADHSVTLRQLLNHTSGIPSYTDLEEEWFPKIPNPLSDAELLAFSAGRAFDFEPGAGWHYNNTGYYMLGMILARSGGGTYGEHLAQALFEPLQLERTRYDSGSALILNRAQGYGLTPDGQLVNDLPLDMGQPGGAGGLLSTGGELVRWQMALTGGRVVSPESFALMSTPTVLPDGEDTGYGFGLVINEFEGRRRVGHEGGIFGFNSTLFWLPDEDFHVAVVSNGEAIASDEIADDIAIAVLGIVKAPVKDEPTTPELRARLVGNYHLEDTPMDARVFVEGEALKCQATDQDAFRLKWQGGDEFRADFDGDVRLVFDADAQGFTLHQGGSKVHATRTD
jgi:D-alanyl-D-alanine carboxypeptidase